MVNNEMQTAAQPTPAPRRPMPAATIDIKEIILLIYSRWYWFIISLVIFIGAAILYLMATPPQYCTNSVIMLQDAETEKPIVDLSELGIGTQSTNIYNEVFMLESPLLMNEVVTRLGLNNRYFTKDGIRRIELYKESPVLVMTADTISSESYSMDVKLDGAGGFELSNFTADDKKDVDKDASIAGKFGQTVKTPIGLFTIAKSPWYNGNKFVKGKIEYVHQSLNEASTYFIRMVNAVPDTHKAQVINIDITDECYDRSIELGNMLLKVYRENIVSEDNQAAVSTIDFINKRLAIMENELDDVESNISSFKSSHLIPDVSASSSAYFGMSISNQGELQEVNTQIAMAQFVKRELQNSGIDATLPMNIGLEQSGIQGQISEYNKMVMERNRLLASGSEANPVISELTTTLNIMRANVLRSLDNYIKTLDSRLANIQSTGARANSELAANPDREKYLLSVERQQKVKEQLYMFLLQKREESELSQAYTKPTFLILANQGGPRVPVAPRSLNIILVALALGLVAPVIIIFVKESLNSTIRGRKDLGLMTLPFVGEIPYGPGKRRHHLPYITKMRSASRQDLVVKEGETNVINEAFRAIRTSLEFMTPDQGKGGRLIAVTSACSGSGKTFVTMNLAMTLALAGKRVLVVDLDMRKASMSKWNNANNAGISKYLIGQAMIGEIIVPDVDGNRGVDLIPVGIIPPNPVELLSHSRLEELFEELRTRYDYVLIDCPPAEIVADARIISSYVDMTLYIIRSGMFEKAMMADLEDFARSDRYNNLAVILNGTDPNSLYRRKRYGYGYAYGYGYGSTTSRKK